MLNGSRAWRTVLGVAAGVLLAGCGEGREYISVGTAPVGGAFYTVGGAITEVINDQQEEHNWRVTAESTGGSMENIRLLEQGEIQAAMSNASITFFAVRGTEGWDKAYDVQSVMTLFPNVALFITRADSSIERVQDLKGKRVYVGPEGAGFEYFVRPILAAHGVGFDEITPVFASQQNAVDLLADGSVAAAMLGGGVPTQSITTAATSMDIRFVPYDEEAKEALLRDYSFFERVTIPAETYPKQSEPYHGLNVGSAHLIVSAEADEEFVYQFTRLVFANREAIKARVAAAGAINETNAVKDTGTPFHPGAIRYYREIGIWGE